MLFAKIGARASGAFQEKKNMRKSNQASKRFAFEQLELRTVLNGTVMATGAGNSLVLTGDAGNNAIVVHQIGTNSDGSGAIIQVLGSGTKINNLDTATTGFSFTFGSGNGNGITSIDIEMAGGSDVVTFANTRVSGSITVNMDDPSSGDVGDGNDVLAMANVHSTNGVITIGLGNGANVATLVRVSSGSDFTLTAGDGHNAVALNTVSSDTSPETANDTFIVTLGSGRFNTVVMVNCTDGPDGTLEISNSGEDGVLIGALNSFSHQSDVTTFRFRAGDLRNNKA
jgi:hypothetical protein